MTNLHENGLSPRFLTLITVAVVASASPASRAAPRPRVAPSDLALLALDAIKIDDGLADELASPPESYCSRLSAGNEYAKATCRRDLADHVAARKRQLLTVTRLVPVKHFDIEHHEFTIEVTRTLAAFERVDEDDEYGQSTGLLVYAGSSLPPTGESTSAMMRQVRWLHEALTQPLRTLKLRVPDERAEDFEQEATLQIFAVQRRSGAEIPGRALINLQPTNIAFVDLVGFVIVGGDGQILADYWPQSPKKWIDLARAMCRGGKVRPSKSAECCWDGQDWDSGSRRCVGAPKCPAGLVAVREDCLEADASGASAEPQADEPQTLSTTDGSSDSREPPEPDLTPEQDGKVARGYVKRGLEAYQTGEYKLAVDYFQQALARDPDNELFASYLRMAREQLDRK